MTEALDERPSFEDMRHWRDMLLADWGDDKQGLDIEQASEEELYFQEFPIASPYGKLAVRTGSAPSDAEGAMDSLTPKDIQISVKPARDRDKYRKQADKLRKAALGLLHVWQKKKDVLRLVAADMVIRRVGVARVMFDDRLWPEVPSDLKTPPTRDEGMDDAMFNAMMDTWDDKVYRWERANRKFTPIIFERRNPRQVRWKENDAGDILAVCEHYQTTVLEAWDLWQRWPKARDFLAGREPNQLVWVSDVWRGKYRAIMLEDEPIFPTVDGVAEHGYPEIPYIIAPFRELGFVEASKRYRGMLTNAAGLYRIEGDVLSMNLWLLAWNSWRTYTGWTNEESDLDIMPGRYIRLDKRKGEYLEMLQGQPVPPELLQMASVVDSYIQRNGVAQGPRTVEGTRSAQQLWAIQAMRQLKVESARDSMERLVKRALELAMMQIELMLQENLTLPVPGKSRTGEDMGEVTFGPKDIDGYWNGFKVAFTRRVDPALIEQGKSFMAMSINKWMPQRMSVEMSGMTDDPTGWINELVDEAIEHSPQMIQLYSLRRVAQVFGKDSDEYKILMQQMMNPPAGGGGDQPAPNQPAGGGGGFTPSSPRGAPGEEGNTGGIAGALRMKADSKVTGNQRATPPQFGGGGTNSSPGGGL